MLCESVSGRTLDDGVVRRLQILTGGSPRSLAVAARLGVATSFRNLLADLLDLVDEHTAYFKSHLESLPAQERRVFLALAELWKPATAREVGQRARMETSKCSAQLGRLMGRGVVLDAGGTGRRKQYYVSERLYNICFLLRRSRGMDSRVAALVQFMDAYYSAPELRGTANNMVAEPDAVDRDMRLICKQRDSSEVTEDVRTMLRTLPRLTAVPPRSIRVLMVAAFALGLDRMASLIRESPSADRLAALLTALELELGDEPRVAIEVREVAEDLRAELARIRNAHSRIGPETAPSSA